MKNPRTSVVHSGTKAEWKILNSALGQKHEIARVPYVPCEDEEANKTMRDEAYKDAKFISDALNSKAEVKSYLTDFKIDVS